MKSNQKMLLLLIALIASMYYWIQVGNGMERIISMIVLVIIAYLLGRTHQSKIDLHNLPNEPNKHQTSQNFQQN